MINKEKRVENKNNQMKKSIIDFQKTIAQLENQNIKYNQNNYNIQSEVIENEIMINKEDKIEEKINILKHILNKQKKMGKNT